MRRVSKLVRAGHSEIHKNENERLPKRHFLVKFCSERAFGETLNLKSGMPGFKSASFHRNFDGFESEIHRNENARQPKHHFSIENSV